MADSHYQDYYNAFISRIINIDHWEYYIGFIQQRGLEVSGQWIIDYSINEDGDVQSYDYNLKTKEFKTSKKDKDHSDFIPIHISNIQSKSIMDISNEGILLEGSCLNHSPFGPVCLMNESNELIYRGVMIRDKKECFGIEFYPDLGLIEYIGCYYNNERHGFGMLYNRKGELIYEGDWLFGSNDYDKNENVILKDARNDRIVHSLIHELVIDEGCGNDYDGDLKLCGFGYLDRIVVKKNSFQNVNSLKISDNCVLKSIETENGERRDDIDSGSFRYVKTVLITSSLIDWLLIDLIFLI